MWIRKIQKQVPVPIAHFRRKLRYSTVLPVIISTVRRQMGQSVRK
jgi:hypothetical protein